LSDKDGYVDVTFTLHSRQWISIANQWVTRSNSSWPSSDVKSQIIDHGVLFVPIGSKGSKNEHIEWRISLFVGEQILMHSFTLTQLLCYALMKLLIKDVSNLDIMKQEMRFAGHHIDNGISSDTKNIIFLI
jgi:hypothetical protein